MRHDHITRSSYGHVNGSLSTLSASDMSNTNSRKPSSKAGAVWLAAACAVCGLVGLLFERSFVIGRRGFDLAEGGEAQIIGCFWLVLSAAFLATLLPDSAVRKRIFALLTVLSYGAVLSIFGYFIYVLR